MNDLLEKIQKKFPLSPRFGEANSSDHTKVAVLAGTPAFNGEKSVLLPLVNNPHRHPGIANSSMKVGGSFHSAPLRLTRIVKHGFLGLGQN